MSQQALTYTQYLKIDELLSLNHPQSEEHDEPLFIAIHQVYELWFKQVLWELSRVQRTLSPAIPFRRSPHSDAFGRFSKSASASSTSSKR